MNVKIGIFPVVLKVVLKWIFWPDGALKRYQAQWDSYTVEHIFTQCWVTECPTAIVTKIVSSYQKI